MTISKKQLIIAALFALCFCVAAWLYSSSKKVEASDTITFPEVTEITNEEKIKGLLNKHKVVVLFVHMDGCGPCKRLSPKFNQLASESKREGVFFAKINREKASNLCFEHDITMFPTVLIFKEEKLQKHFSGCSQKSVAFFANAIDDVMGA